MRAICVLVALLPCVAHALDLGCSGTRHFVSATRTCIECASPSTFDVAQERCVCPSPFIEAWSADGATVTCANCALQRLMPGTGGPGGAPQCLPCSDNATASTFVPPPASVECSADLFAQFNTSTPSTAPATTLAPNVTNPAVFTSLPPVSANASEEVVNITVSYANSTVDIMHSSWDAGASACACPAGYVLTASINGLYLGAWACVTCGDCAIRCPEPLQWNPTAEACRCAEGLTLFETADGARCLTDTLSNLLAGVDTRLTSVYGPNVGNSGRATDRTQSHIIETTYLASTVGCSVGNSTACNALANLCVLAFYDQSNTACALYRQLQVREPCRGLSCEQPTTVPWLYYLRSSTDIMRNNAIRLRVSLAPRPGTEFVDRMRLILARYDVNGTFLGHDVLTSQLSVCNIPAAVSQVFFLFGARREVTCNLNLRWFLAAPPTEVYELFIEDIDGTLHDVPVLMLTDPADGDFIPQNTEDPRIFRSASSGDPLPDSYRRRFFIYDNVGSRPSAGAHPAYVTYARRVQLMFTLQPGHESKIFPPLLVVQYATEMTSAMVGNSDLTSGELRFLRTNITTPGDYADSGVERTLYVQNTNEAEYAARTTVIVLCCVTLLSAFIRSYGWMRRQQDMVLGLPALIRFVIYYFNHLANLFALFDIIFCAVFYIFYKLQADVDYLLPEDYTYVTATLYTAGCMKGIVVLYRIIEQTNADIFVIDWERSKGVLKSTEKEVSVSMWRSTFIANEFNEMQVLRGFHVMIHMFVVSAFLEGGDYIQAARSVPSSAGQSDIYTSFHPLLRIAVCSFFWLVIGLGFHLLEYQVYYRFIQTHPLQAFVDLCSVSNISIMVLLEPQWGFYIHGESIHAYADASMEEFQRNLQQEAHGNLPQRGIAGNCQTFEVFLGQYMRQFLTLSYHQLYTAFADPSGANAAASGGAEGDMDTVAMRPGQPGYGVPVQQTFGCFEFLRKRMPVNLTPDTVKIKKRINSAFQASVREAQRTVLAKFGVHLYLDFPPNILYMNGPFAGEKAGGDLFFVDDVKSYGNALMYGLDVDIFILYLLVFLSLDTALVNVFGSMAITFALELALHYYRKEEGEANIARKTLFDDRFFL